MKNKKSIKQNRFRIVYLILLCIVISMLFTVSGLCSNTSITFSQDGVSIWKDENSKIEANIKVYGNEGNFELDASNVKADYDQIVLNMSSDKLFDVNKNDQLRFIYQYTGTKPLYLNLGICDMDGEQYRMNQEFTYGIKTEKGIQLLNSQNGSVVLEPKSVAEIILPLDWISNLEDTVQDCYGFSFSALIQNQDKCELNISKLGFLMNEDCINLHSYQNIGIEGDELVFVPEMGDLWIDYKIISDHLNDITFESKAYDNGCAIDQNGRLYMSSDTKESKIQVVIKTKEGYFISKEVSIAKIADFKGIYVKPEERKVVQFDLSVLADQLIQERATASVLAAIALTVVGFILMELYILRMERKERMEEEDL